MVASRASDDGSRRFYNHGDGPHISSFTFKTLLRHYAKWAPKPCIGIPISHLHFYIPWVDSCLVLCLHSVLSVKASMRVQPEEEGPSP